MYLQVQTLFKDAPDLLAEFKNFLPPDGSGHSFAAEAMQEHTWDEAMDRRNAAPRRKKKAVDTSASGAMQATMPIQNQRAPGGRVSVGPLAAVRNSH